MNFEFHHIFCKNFQIDNCDMLSLQGTEACLDPETEQLISDIERLTSQALQETNQWTDQPLGLIPENADSSSGLVVVVGASKMSLDNEEENNRNNNEKMWTIAN